MTENWGAYSDYFKSEFFKNFGATAARVKISAEVHSLFEPSTSYKCIIEADRILISSIGKHRFSARFSVRENIGFFNDKPMQDSEKDYFLSAYKKILELVDQGNANVLIEQKTDVARG